MISYLDQFVTGPDLIIIESRLCSISARRLVPSDKKNIPSRPANKLLYIKLLFPH